VTSVSFPSTLKTIADFRNNGLKPIDALVGVVCWPADRKTIHYSMDPQFCLWTLTLFGIK